jgi:hypothetical protein
MAKTSDPKPPEPNLGRVDAAQATRTVIVTSTPGEWKPEIEFPDWMSPYEVHALLSAATAKVADKCPGIGDYVSEDDD